MVCACVSKNLFLACSVYYYTLHIFAPTICGCIYSKYYGPISYHSFNIIDPIINVRLYIYIYIYIQILLRLNLAMIYTIIILCLQCASIFQNISPCSARLYDTKYFVPTLPIYQTKLVLHLDCIQIENLADSVHALYIHIYIYIYQRYCFLCSVFDIQCKISRLYVRKSFCAYRSNHFKTIPKKR